MKDYLDSLLIKYNTPDFIENDPVQFPHRYSEKNDIEIVAFLTATIAWGKRSMILNSANKMLNIMGKSPYDFIMSEGFKDLDNMPLLEDFILPVNKGLLETDMECHYNEELEKAAFDDLNVIYARQLPTAPAKP